MSFQKVAVVGATGPTGQALTAELTAREVPVRVVSRSQERLEAAFPDPAVEKRAGDAMDAASIAEAVAGCDAVVDCIGLPPARMADHPKTAENIARAVEKSGARCLQISSYWCYMPIAETPVSVGHPRDGGPPWARIRREAEDILRDAGGCIVHLPDFFGPHVAVGTMQMALEDAVAGKPMNWIGGTDVERDYGFVPDLMRDVAELMTREEAYGDDWIIPGSGPVSANALAAMLSEILGRSVKVRAVGPFFLRVIGLFNSDLRAFLQLEPEYVKPISFDGSKLRGLIGPVSRTGHREALAATVAALRRDAD